MNTSQLECFVQVALNLSFRRAAEELHLSQPTVSKQIASLESELGGALFVRSTRQVMLTTLGEMFLKDAQEILCLSYAAEERAKRQARGGNLVIAYSDANELFRLSFVLEQLRHEHAEMNVLLQQGPRDSNVSQLSREQVDVVLGFESKAQVSKGLKFSQIATSHLSCIVNVDSPLAQLDEVGPADVEGMPQVLCLPPGVRRHGSLALADMPTANDATTTRCATSSEAYALVNAGFGYAIVPSLFTMPDPLHKVLRWKGRANARYGIFHRASSRTGLVPHFVALARDVYGRPEFSQMPPI